MHKKGAEVSWTCGSDDGQNRFIVFLVVIFEGSMRELPAQNDAHSKNDRGNVEHVGKGQTG